MRRITLFLLILLTTQANANAKDKTDSVYSLSPYMKTVSLRDFYKVNITIPLAHHSTPITVSMHLIPAKGPVLDKLEGCGHSKKNLSKVRLLYGLNVKRYIKHPFGKMKKTEIIKRSRKNSKHPHQSDYDTARKALYGISRYFVATIAGGNIYIALYPTSWCDGGGIILSAKYSRSGFSGLAVWDDYSGATIGSFKAVPMYDWVRKNALPVP